jgi:hypothetical protein
LRKLIGVLFLAHLGAKVVLAGNAKAWRRSKLAIRIWCCPIFQCPAERQKTMEGHRRHAIQSKRWSTGLLILSEVFFVVANLSLAMSLE